MMRKGLFLVFILVLLVNTREIRGQQVDQSSSPSVSEIPAAFSMLFNRILVYPWEGRPLSGLLVGVSSDALVVRIGSKDEKIPYRNLAKVIVETKKKTSSNALYGILMGTYLGNLIFSRAKNQPTAYMEDTENKSTPGLVLSNIAFAAGGGLLGILISSILEKNEITFNFTGREEKRQAEWEKLQRYVMGKTSLKKIHLSIQAGHVFTQVSPRYFNLLQNAGYNIYGYYWDEYREVERASDFNLLRKCQLTVSLMPNTEIGFALYWLGEPSLYVWKYNDHQSIHQSLSTVGYYVVGTYKLVPKWMPKRVAWNVGLGLGAAKVNFSLKSTLQTEYPTYESLTTEHNITKTLFSGIVFTELNFFFQDTLSLGLVADYVFVPIEDAPSIPDAGIPAQKLHLGTGSIGFTLGLHF